MTFRDIIEEIHRKDPGVRSGALVGADGLTVEEWHAPGDDRDLSALCAEIVQIFRQSDRVASDNGLGAAQEIQLAGDHALSFVRRVTADYFLVVVTTAATVPGRCRFLMRQAARRAVERM